ncbi:adenine deaminase [Faecalicatena contorta]|uniref:Adenine deaminase n=1 Tax=Faecalicatena contorta TaxID=39482 RepID=A0A315ZVR4_9FIRM|nr:adenine deaminase C-terminal domain-containing protein [Faecalicatena contorta]PWJ48714.1 adenine deaminase [Faecalicatena contorta]SUQ15137.1 Adenine deaminase [Faecalicatena contorta]
MDVKLLEVAAGKTPADIVVKNGKIVNVYTKEIYKGGVAVSGNTIAAVGEVDYTIGEGTKVIDAEGNFITPGFIDGHIHPESTGLSIRSFAELVLKHGTTAIMTDLHEVGVVGGLEAIEAVLEEAGETDLKLYFIVPSHVPFAPNLETSGGHFDAEIIKKALQRKDAVGLSEIVGPYILSGFPDLLQSMDMVNQMPGKTCQGHLPEMMGPALNTCLAAGVTTDHESLSGEEAVARLRNGCHLMIREGSAAQNLADCIKAITEEKLDTSRVSIVTDDLHTIDAVDNGHLDEAVRRALKAGVDFPSAIQMVSLNAARAFHLDDEIGGLAPGRRADINITTGEEDFKVLSVISGGKEIVDHGKCLVAYPKAEHAPCLLNTTKLRNPVTPESFKMHAPQGAKRVKVQVMDTLPWIPITQGREVELAVEDGVIKCDVEQDVLYIAQVERYGVNGNIGKAFMGGFHLKEGAIASSVGHDNHNIIVMGTNFEDMAIAVNHLIEIGGGQNVVKDGEVLAEISYPVCGLLSDLSGEELAEEKRKLNEIIHKLGSPIKIPFMFLSFICLAAIPMYAVTDMGFIDVMKQEVISPIIEVIE